MSGKEDLAWVGCTRVQWVFNNTTPRKYPTLLVNICQIHKTPLLKIRRVTRIFRWRRGIGKVYGPYVRKSRNDSPCYYYNLYGKNNVRYFITLIWPYLSHPKKLQYLRSMDKMKVGPQPLTRGELKHQKRRKRLNESA